MASFVLVMQGLAAGTALAANSPPTISGTPITSVPELVAYSFTPTASDVDGDTLRFAITGKPAWAVFDVATGKLTGTPSSTQAGTYSNIVISVRDNRASVTLPAFTITVTNTNIAPVITGTPLTRATAGMAYKFQPAATDQDGDKLTYTVTGKPFWATLNTTTGALTGTPPTGTDQVFKDIKLGVSDGKATTYLPTFSIDVAGAIGANQPTGVYSLDIVVDKPFVDGVVVKPSWAELEPIEGQYDFSQIDRAVTSAAEVGQSVTILNFTGTPPQWLINKVPAENRYLNAKGATTIVPWDTTMMAALQKLALAQAQYTVGGVALRDHPTVKQVMAGIGGTTHVRLLPVPPGYSFDKFLNAVDLSLGYWAAAYPSGKHLYVGMFHFKVKGAPTTEPDTLRDYVLDKYDGVSRPRIHFFEELLTGQTPMPDSPNSLLLKGAGGRTGIMFQACAPWLSQDTGLWNCQFVEPIDSPELGVALAMNNFGSKYFEFYAGDLKAPEYEGLFTRIRQAIDVGPSVLLGETPIPVTKPSAGGGLSRKTPTPRPTR